MTQKRYFYTDAIAAAYMAKHFGMKFGIKHNGKIAWNCISEALNNNSWGPLATPDDILDPISRHECLYIHPDSLHLLEPQKGDKVSYSWGQTDEGWDEVKAIVSSGDEGYAVTGNGERCVLIDSGDYPYISRITRIFQRNGLPFMWPQGEAA
jgi:hypothetical protein